MNRGITQDIRVRTRNMPTTFAETPVEYNNQRRTFFKYAAMSGVSLFSIFLINKLSDIKKLGIPSTKISMKNKIGNLAYTENKNEVVFYDKSGEGVLIFEK